jgi:NhaP-type Na+/H+ or K+/H+ antiporter
MLVGIAAGPAVLDLIGIDFVRDSPWLERLTEITLIVSLFVGGLKLRVPFSDRAWRSAIRLASVAMVLTVGAVGALVHALLHFDWPMALMLGAMLAPTDPVLSSIVAVGGADDRDDLRVALSAEAGFNDGTVLPLFLLGLAVFNTGFSWPTAMHWGLVQVLWGVPAGLAIGYAMGRFAGAAVVRLRTSTSAGAPGDLLMLALLLLAYAAAHGAHALGFLAVFAAGLGLRGAEVAIVNRQPQAEPGHAAPPGERPPAEDLVDPRDDGAEQRQPTLAVGRMMFGALSFGDTLERLLGTLLVLLLGVLLVEYWSLRGLLIAAVLLLVIRPAVTWLATMGLGLPWRRRVLLGWLGIRGIGSLYYLAFALTHGLASVAQSRTAIGIVVTVVAVSIAVHGISAPPLLRWRQRALERKGT